jgi:hypothetical protein
MFLNNSQLINSIKKRVGSWNSITELDKSKAKFFVSSGN